MGGLAKNSSVTEGKYIDPTMTPCPNHMMLTVSLAGSRRPPSNTKIGLCKPLALGYQQNVP
jgi:hypothetical protein